MGGRREARRERLWEEGGPRWRGSWALALPRQPQESRFAPTVPSFQTHRADDDPLRAALANGDQAWKAPEVWGRLDRTQ